MDISKPIYAVNPKVKNNRIKPIYAARPTKANKRRYNRTKINSQSYWKSMGQKHEAQQINRNTREFMNNSYRNWSSHINKTVRNSRKRR